MDFEFGGRRLRCSLTQFQARTESAVLDVVEEPPAREAATTIESLLGGPRRPSRA